MEASMAQSKLSVEGTTRASDLDGVELAQEVHQHKQPSVQDRLSDQQLQDRETLPLTITSLVDVKIVEAACGDTHLLLLSSMGAVYSLGVGRSGQLGKHETSHTEHDLTKIFAPLKAKHFMFEIPQASLQLACSTPAGSHANHCIPNHV